MTPKDIQFRQFQIRKFNRRRMVPVVSMTIDVEAEKMLERKNLLNAENGKGLHVTITHLILKAVADTLVHYPALYSFFDRGRVVGNDELVMNIPVDVESHVEYIVIHAPETKSLEEIATECTKELELIRAGKGTYFHFITFMNNLSLLTKLGYLFSHNKIYAFMKQHYGNFPVSNFGSFHIPSGIVTLSQPMIGSLCIGSIIERENRLSFSMTLSFDHRAIDGAYGGKFLNEVKTRLELPGQLIKH
jgi:pyruvate dehydrogenase E2 component (dihydrolipoamide acetyltransferase)